MSMTSEKCPHCGSYDYTVLDSDSEMMPPEIRWWWDCECDNCHKIFTITEYYQLIGRVITKEE